MADETGVTLDEDLNHGQDEGEGDEPLDEGEEDAVEGDEGQEPEDDGQENDDGNDDGRQVRPAEVRRSRGANRFQTLSNENKELKQRLERLEGSFTAPRGPSPEEIARQQAQRQQHLLSLDPESRTQFLLEEQRAEFRNELAQIRFQTADSTDRTNFQTLARNNRAYAAVADEVERILQTERAAGRPGGARETLAQWVIGKRAVERASAATSRQTKRAVIGKAREQGRPGNGRGDVASPGRQSNGTTAARNKRLEGITI